MYCRISKWIMTVSLILGFFGCSAILEREETNQIVSLSDLPEAAKVTIDRLTAGGEIIKLEKEEVDGKTIYDVEAKMPDKEVEYDVAADGTILSSEKTVPYDSLPEVVRTAVERYFGTNKVIKTSQEIEDNKIFYEVEGQKNGSTVELKLSEAGKIVEEE